MTEKMKDLLANNIRASYDSLSETGDFLGGVIAAMAKNVEAEKNGPDKAFMGSILAEMQFAQTAIRKLESDLSDHEDRLYAYFAEQERRPSKI